LAKTFLKIFLILITASSLLSASNRFQKKNYTFDQRHFKTGDVLLQHIPGRLTSVIKDVTNSFYSHCGMVVIKNRQIYVIEAIGPVKYTPLSRWLKQGRDNFTQLRPLYFENHQLAMVVTEAEKLLGKPYDIQYELDEEKIYCSELIYKAFLRASKKEVGKKEALSTLNWKPHEDFIRHLCRGQLPLKRELVTPESLSVNPNFTLIRSTFPRSANYTAEKNNQSLNFLSGDWHGEYTISKDTVSIKLSFSKKGVFSKGSLKLNNGRLINIKSLNVDTSKTNGFYTAKILDDRKVSANMKFHLKDDNNRIIGTWKDKFYNHGNFSIEKILSTSSISSIYNDTINTNKENEGAIDVYSKLKKLYELRQQNILTEEEYQRVKNRLLNQIK